MNYRLFHIVILYLVVVIGLGNGHRKSESLTNLEDYLQPLDVGRNLTYDNMIDDGKICSRDCTLYPEPRICYYKFVAEQYHAMGPACKNCPFNQEDCFSPQCIIADGIERTVLSFNRLIPGPAIQVCYGDRIIVDVHNKMPDREITIHWHGELQKKSAWMDGVPYVSQCPILQNTKFRYDFNALTVGSHFYHSHSGFQLFDGLSGSLIVRTSKEVDPVKEYYDYDLFSHTIQLQDWMHVLTDVKIPGYNRNRTLITLKPDTYLINGQGSYINPVTLTSTGTPFAEFNVKPNKKYRFRIIGVTSTTCSYRFTIEGHTMKLIAADGYPIEPKNVRTLYMSAGDIYDVVIETNQNPRPYWIRVQGYSGECTPAFQQAILKYEGSSSDIPQTPNTEALFDSLKTPEFNSVRKDCHLVDDDICLDELNSLYKAPDRLLAPEPDVRFIFKIQAHLFTAEELYLSNTYHRHYLPFSAPDVIPNREGTFTDTINNKTNMFPPIPLLNDPTNPQIKKMLCPEICDDFCECLHLYELQLDSVVEVVLIDTLSHSVVQMDHPFHLHGHHYSVMKLGTKDDLEKPDFYRLDNVNEYPMVRDSIPIPAAGFAVVRFIADNPGFWPLHCHFTAHNKNGMVVVFQVGNTSEIPMVPRNWPKCGDYLPPFEKSQTN